MSKRWHRLAVMWTFLLLGTALSSCSMFQSKDFGPAQDTTSGPQASIPSEAKQAAANLPSPANGATIGVLNLSESIITHLHIGTVVFANFAKAYPQIGAPLQQYLSEELRREVMRRTGKAALELYPSPALRAQALNFLAQPKFFNNQRVVNPAFSAEIDALIREHHLETLIVAVPLQTTDPVRQSYSGFAMRSRSFMGLNRAEAWPALTICLIDRQLNVRTPSYSFFDTSKGVSFVSLSDVEIPGKDDPIPAATLDALETATRELLNRQISSTLALLQ